MYIHVLIFIPQLCKSWGKLLRSISHDRVRVSLKGKQDIASTCVQLENVYFSAARKSEWICTFKIIYFLPSQQKKLIGLVTLRTN